MNELRQYFADAFRHMGGNRGVPPIEVRFYPYAGLRHTIRLRSGRVYVRLSDICKDSPPEVLRALAWILVAPITVPERLISTWLRTVQAPFVIGPVLLPAMHTHARGSSIRAPKRATLRRTELSKRQITMHGEQVSALLTGNLNHSHR